MIHTSRSQYVNDLHHYPINVNKSDNDPDHKRFKHIELQTTSSTAYSDDQTSVDTTSP